MLTIFYDGYCPLCTAEMNLLRDLDNQKKLILEDIHAADFSERFPHIDPIQADKILHGQLQNGEVIKGLDVTCLAWKLVGKHKWMQVLRWPVIRLFADLGYLFFARYRHSISSFVTGKPRCTSCQKEL
ncbi:thiol-disulfide oxidoreductase DCC family protein [Marinomonas sp. 2405UD66-6]|uniref:thiol-disulfide oxidoreductase DCC family protein n=1 Tax=Marinomonas sp. 2405UD66-6 TaxID=3391834 RepID=UPI0039C9752B